MKHPALLTRRQLCRTLASAAGALAFAGLPFSSLSAKPNPPATKKADGEKKFSDKVV